MRTVAVLAYDGISPFHLSVPCLVLGDRHAPPTRYDVLVCAEHPGPLRTNAGFGVTVDRGLDVMDEADVVVLPSWDPGREPSAVLIDAIRRAHARGATVVGLCVGAFLVAASGIARRAGGGDALALGGAVAGTASGADRTGGRAVVGSR